MPDGRDEGDQTREGDSQGTLGTREDTGGQRRYWGPEVKGGPGRLLGSRGNTGDYRDDGGTRMNMETREITEDQRDYWGTRENIGDQADHWGPTPKISASLPTPGDLIWVTARPSPCYPEMLTGRPCPGRMAPPRKARVCRSPAHRPAAHPVSPLKVGALSLRDSDKFLSALYLVPGLRGVGERAIGTRARAGLLWGAGVRQGWVAPCTPSWCRPPHDG